MDKYICEICGLQVIVKGKTNGKSNKKLLLDFREGKEIINTWEVCEVCAEKLVEYSEVLRQSAKEFYFKG
jgi:hypothetical protein